MAQHCQLEIKSNEGGDGGKLLEIDAFLALPLDQSKFRDPICTQKLKKLITGFLSSSPPSKTLLFYFSHFHCFKNRKRPCATAELNISLTKPFPLGQWRKAEFLNICFLSRCLPKTTFFYCELFLVVQKRPKDFCALTFDFDLYSSAC